METSSSPPTPAAAVSLVSEVFREMETYRYDDLSWTSAALNDSNDLIAPSSLVSASDPSLTAYAQLGVYRLGGSRALISLFDRDRQHVVAEAVRNSPIAPSRPAHPNSDPSSQKDEEQDYFHHSQPTVEENDGFWLCGTAIPRSFGVCDHVLVGNKSSNSFDELPVSVVPELATDPRFQDRPYIYGPPFNRFYAGVPIRSPGPDGFNIGVYCVFGKTPRPQGLSNDEVSFMQDISRTVMSYLECRRSLGRFRRSERMVRGMGNFVEGSDSLTLSASAPSRGMGHSRNTSLNVVEPADSAEVADGRTLKQTLVRHPKPEALPKGIGGVGRLFDEALLSPRTPLPSNQSMGPTTAGWIPRHFQSRSMSTYVPDESSRSTTPRPHAQQSEELGPKLGVVSHVSTADLKLAETGQVFAKAANIIRQCLAIDGVLFLDATVRSFEGLVGPQNERKVSTYGLDEMNYLSNDEDSAPHDNFCPVLGFSTPDGSSIKGSPVPLQYEGLRDKTLQRLLKRYPNGRILNFEANGEIFLPSSPPIDQTQMSPGVPPRRPVSPKREWSQYSHLSETLDSASWDGTDGSPQIRKPRSSVAESIIHLFPGARSVAVIALWDRQKKRWVAGGFAWTKDPTRIFTTDGTLSFLRVFGMIAMAEIYRLDTKAEETMKSNILGSISHELRSPLHGLVGAVELLNDSKLDAVQQNVLSIIETSGKTLVDTINHILDYSKINSIIESEKKDTFLGKVGAERKSRAKASRALPVELDCLVEEVVESVLAGFSHERRVARDATEYKKYADALAGQVRHPAHTDRVHIFLDIEPAASWLYPAHPGAFRRIVMNLFGNALKFTSSGFIKVSLAQDPARRSVLLTVADSGKGISEEYLQNGLFTPFCQEDQFAPGTGLGLSLVRQLAVNLGGEVKVASQVGRGTTMTVSLPFSDMKDELASGDALESRQDIDKLKGLKVVIRGFENVASMESDLTAQGPLTAGRLANSQAHALENTCREWLQMEVLDEGDARQPDFIIQYDSSLSFEDGEAMGVMATCPVLFVCDPSVASRNFSCNLPDATSRIRTFEFFSPPLGPRKLAKGLVHLLDIWKVKQDENPVVQETTVASVEVLPPKMGSQTVTMLDGKEVVVSAAELEVGDGVKVFKSAETSVVATQTVQYMATPLPTPPDEPSSKSPMGKPEAELEPLASGEADGSSEGEGPAVLIVDDNAINMKILSAYMKKLGRRHVTAINGLESSNMYAQAPSAYCCILTDISMPTMDGLESARRIRQHERTHRLQKTPIIALTGLAGVGVQEDAVASGVDMFLTRPVTLSRLIEALEAVGLPCS